MSTEYFHHIHPHTPILISDLEGELVVKSWQMEGDITTDFIEIAWILREYYEQLYMSKIIYLK
jgi:hypothetical protein